MNDLTTKRIEDLLKARRELDALLEFATHNLPTFRSFVDNVNSEHFDALCYRYRTWPTDDPEGVSHAFQEIKQCVIGLALLCWTDE